MAVAEILRVVKGTSLEGFESNGRLLRQADQKRRDPHVRGTPCSEIVKSKRHAVLGGPKRHLQVGNVYPKDTLDIHNLARLGFDLDRLKVLGQNGLGRPAKVGGLPARHVSKSDLGLRGCKL